MKPVAIDYFDGNTSRASPGELWLDAHGVCWLSVEGQRRYFALADLTISPRLGNTPRSLSFPDGATAETADNDGIDRLLVDHQPARRRWLHRLESHYGAVLAAVLVTALLTIGFVAYGVPWLAGRVAEVLPPEVDQTLGRQTLAALDEAVFRPSSLEDATKAHYLDRFAALVAGQTVAGGARLIFRASPVIGANALALPDGTVVLTDELVALAADSAEVEAVLAHELGHVAGRHALRSALQRSLVVLVVAAVTGDVGSAGGLASVLPVVLVDAGYSRDLEREADRYALGLMKARGIPLAAFPAMLKRLVEASGGGQESGFLDTHPTVPERAALFRAGAPRG